MKFIQEKFLLKIIESQIAYYNHLLREVYPEEEMWLDISEDKKEVVFHDWGFFEIECGVDSDWSKYLAEKIKRYENKLKELEA